MFFRKTSKLAKKNDTQPKIGTRGYATPFPSKTPFGTTKIQKLLHVPIGTNCQTTYMSSIYITYM
jgi:hypothetical protein